MGLHICTRDCFPTRDELGRFQDCSPSSLAWGVVRYGPSCLFHPPCQGSPRESLGGLKELSWWRGTQWAAHAVQRSLLGVQLFPGISLQWGVEVGGGQQVLVEPRLPWRWACQTCQCNSLRVKEERRNGR